MANESVVDQIKASGKESRKNAGYSGLLDSAASKQAAWQDYYQSLQDASNQSSLLKEGAGIDLVQGAQDGSYQLLNNLLNQGYIDPSQRQDLFAKLNAAGGMASQYAQDGGVDPASMQLLVDEYVNARGKANTLAERGGLTSEEYSRILNSGRNDLMRSGRAAAESTFNQANPASPFAASALMAQNAANTGAEMVKQRADLDMYQSDTRMKGLDALRDLLGQASDTLMQRAGNKLKGVDALSGLIDQQSDIAGKSSSFADSIAGSAFDTLSSLVKSKDRYNNKGQYLGTDIETPYSKDKQPWEKNNTPFAPGFVEYGSAGNQLGFKR